MYLEKIKYTTIIETLLYAISKSKVEVTNYEELLSKNNYIVLLWKYKDGKEGIINQIKKLKLNINLYEGLLNDILNLYNKNFIDDDINYEDLDKFIKRNKVLIKILKERLLNLNYDLKSSFSDEDSYESVILKKKSEEVAMLIEEFKDKTKFKIPKFKKYKSIVLNPYFNLEVTQPK